jgi:anionic cell wall polymer biosynthesis LytR-Cps2A-Psr (LCP) family protein
MALVKRQSTSSKTIVIGVVVVVVVVLGYFLFQKFYLNPESTNTKNSSNSSGRVITNFGESLLNDAQFNELQTLTVNTSVNLNTDAGQEQPFQ